MAINRFKDLLGGSEEDRRKKRNRKKVDAIKGRMKAMSDEEEGVVDPLSGATSTSASSVAASVDHLKSMAEGKFHELKEAAGDKLKKAKNTLGAQLHKVAQPMEAADEEIRNDELITDLKNLSIKISELMVEDAKHPKIIKFNEELRAMQERIAEANVRRMRSLQLHTGNEPLPVSNSDAALLKELDDKIAELIGSISGKGNEKVEAEYHKLKAEKNKSHLKQAEEHEVINKEAREKKAAIEAAERAEREQKSWTDRIIEKVIGNKIEEVKKGMGKIDPEALIKQDQILINLKLFKDDLESKMRGLENDEDPAAKKYKRKLSDIHEEVQNVISLREHKIREHAAHASIESQVKEKANQLKDNIKALFGSKNDEGDSLEDIVAKLLSESMEKDRASVDSEDLSKLDNMISRRSNGDNEYKEMMQEKFYNELKSIVMDHEIWGNEVKFMGGDPILVGEKTKRVPTGIENMLRCFAGESSMSPASNEKSRFKMFHSPKPVSLEKAASRTEVNRKEEVYKVVEIAGIRSDRKKAEDTSNVNEFYKLAKNIGKHDFDNPAVLRVHMIKIQQLHQKLKDAQVAKKTAGSPISRIIRRHSG